MLSIVISPHLRPAILELVHAAVLARHRTSISRSGSCHAAPTKRRLRRSVAAQKRMLPLI